MLVHKCSWRIQNVCRNNCRRVKAKVAEHVAARLGVAGALHLHRGLQSVHLGAVRGQGLGHKIMLHGENGKDEHGHHHWGRTMDITTGSTTDITTGGTIHIIDTTFWENMILGTHTMEKMVKMGMALMGTMVKMGTITDMAVENIDTAMVKIGYVPYGHNGKNGHHYGYGNGKYRYGNGKNGYGLYGYSGKNGHHNGYSNGKYGYGNGHHHGYHSLLGLLDKGIYYDPAGPVTTAKNQLCVKVCHKEPRKSCWDAKELKCKRTGKKICHLY